MNGMTDLNLAKKIIKFPFTTSYYGTEGFPEQQKFGWTIKTCYYHARSLFFHYLDGEYENFDITPYSTPPDLPDVMRTPDVSGGQLSSIAAGGKE